MIINHLLSSWNNNGGTQWNKNMMIVSSTEHFFVQRFVKKSVEEHLGGRPEGKTKNGHSFHYRCWGIQGNFRQKVDKIGKTEQNYCKTQHRQQPVDVLSHFHFSFDLVQILSVQKYHRKDENDRNLNQENKDKSF